MFNAYVGFLNLGLECILFKSYEELDENYHSRNDVISGGIGIIVPRLKSFGIDVPTIDYPKSIESYLGRNIWKSTINTIANQQDKYPIFVKSTEQKLMTGKVIRSIADLVGEGSCEGDFDVYCSDVVDMKSEYRIFVRYGKVLDVKLYRGDYHYQLDMSVVDKAIREYEDSGEAPNAYGIDFAATADGRTILIEVNDGFALGCYGMPFWNYSKFLITRWAQLTDTIDEFWYI